MLLSRAGLTLAAMEPVWVLLSDQHGAYAEAVAGLQADWKGALQGRELVVLPGRELPPGPPPGALVVFGSSALRVAAEHVERHPEWAKVPVLAALLPRVGFAAAWKRPLMGVSAAYLDQPVERYLELARRAFPRLSRVGVLLGGEAGVTRAALSKGAAERGQHLAVGVVSGPDAVYASLRSVLAESDVLLVLPDGAVSDPSALQNILITAYRQRVPVVAYSPALAKAGAAVSLFASPTQVGRQVALMLRGAPIASNWPAPRWADGVSVAVNDQVCRSLGLDVPDSAELADAIRRQEGGK